MKPGGRPVTAQAYTSLVRSRRAGRSLSGLDVCYRATLPALCPLAIQSSCARAFAVHSARLAALMDTQIEKMTGIMGEKNDLPYYCLH